MKRVRSLAFALEEKREPDLCWTGVSGTRLLVDAAVVGVRGKANRALLRAAPRYLVIEAGPLSGLSVSSRGGLPVICRDAALGAVLKARQRDAGWRR